MGRVLPCRFARGEVQGLEEGLGARRSNTHAQPVMTMSGATEKRRLLCDIRTAIFA